MNPKFVDDQCAPASLPARWLDTVPTPYLLGGPPTSGPTHGPANGASARPATPRPRVAEDEPMLRSWDGALDAALSRLVNVAAALAGTPTAAVSLLGSDAVHFRAAIGFHLPEVPRQDAPCASAAGEAEFLEIADATLDATFSRHPMVVGELGMRHYFGAPLRTRGGALLGVLCVFGREPRLLDAPRRESLLLLARHIADEIETRARLRQHEQRIDARRRGESAVSQLSMRDALTALPNRTALLQRLDQGLRVARRAKQMLGVVVLNVDVPRPMGQRLSQAASDEIATQMARRLSAGLRESDVVARLSDDEFAIVFGQVDSIDGAQATARKILGLVPESCELGGESTVLACHLGVALFPQHGVGGAQLIHSARQAAAIGRSMGGRTYRLVDETTEATPMLAWEASDFASDLRRALLEDEIQLAFEPQWSLASDALGAIAVTPRWQHRRHGQIPPEQFIPLAEESGVIDELARHCYDRALALWATWKALGVALPKLVLKLSPLQIRGPLIRDLQALLQRHGVDAHEIEIDLAEAAVLAEGPALPLALDELRALGFSIAIQDFGSGYMSLPMLQRLPLRALKIDRGFIEDVDRSMRSAAIVEAMITLGRSLGLALIADGVERAEQQSLLRRLGCDAAQGSLLTGPLTEDALPGWLAEHAAGRRPA